MSTEHLGTSAGLRQLKNVHAAATVAHLPVVLATGFVAIPVDSEDAGVENTFNVEVDVLKVVKASGQTWAGGEKVYWHDTNKHFTTTNTGAVLCGYTLAPAENAEAVGKIRLTPNVNA